MYEVFRAMKTLDFEWKILNPYHVIVRKKCESTNIEQVSCVELCIDLFVLAEDESSTVPSRPAQLSTRL
jgi:5'-AMP-activated protein kinase catalytic alpha subunit